MSFFLDLQEHTNFVFVGEAGSGKSELSLNFGRALHAWSGERISFFDMDMTKPLFRSRECKDALNEYGVDVEYEAQYYDAPTVVGGVGVAMRDKKRYTILDVGGDHIGARSIGRFHKELKRDDTLIFYVLNPFRVWSYDMDHILETLGKIVGVAHLKEENLRFVNNPNMGVGTTAELFNQGTEKIKEILNGAVPISFSGVKEELVDEVKDSLSTPILPVRLFLTPEWSGESAC